MYLSNFDSKEAVSSSFDVTLDQDIKIVFAAYEYEDYQGSALVIDEQQGRLYEVNGGHCSCNGLEGQWEPEETTIEALHMRDLSGWHNGEDANEHLFQFLNALQNK